MKLGVVLTGGGGKGAYQIGVLKALKDNDINFDDISGASIGSLNGIMLAQDELDKAFELWSDLEKTYSFDVTIGDTIDRMPEDFKSRYPEIKELGEPELNKFALDEKLLVKVVEDRFDPEKFKKYKGDVYACVRNCTKNTTEYINMKRLNQSEVTQFLWASCAFPGLSQGVSIKEVDYIDGGVFDNVPVKPLLDKNLDLILIIHLRTKKRTVDPENSADNIINLYPSESLGNLATGTLDTSSVNMKERLRLGYEDGLKIIKEIGEKIGSVRLR